ncbi:MAG: hypothetical protein R2834_01015 [Rhodothermales bacterium]
MPQTATLPASTAPRRRTRSWSSRFLGGLFTVFALVALPFILLVRTSLYLYLQQQMHTWVAIAGGIVVTGFVLFAYTAYLRRRWFGSWEMSGRVFKTMLLIVALYSGYSMMYISSSNVKTESVRSTYRSLHPILRIATSTLVLVNRDLVVTDAGRTPADYKKMGLPVREQSLHYKQGSGYVEAVDIRTHGRSEIANGLVRLYFWAMGFNTLRHVGTADHLHVSMPAAR